MISFLFNKPPIPKFVKLGKEVMVDVDSVSAMYRSGDRLIIRVGGMGIMDIHRSHLDYDFSECIDLVMKYKG